MLKKQFHCVNKVNMEMMLFYTVSVQNENGNHTEKLDSGTRKELYTLTALPTTAIWTSSLQIYNMTRNFSFLEDFKLFYLCLLSEYMKENKYQKHSPSCIKKIIKQIIPVQIGKTWQDHQEQGFLHLEECHTYMLCCCHCNTSGENKTCYEIFM